MEKKLKEKRIRDAKIHQWLMGVWLRIADVADKVAAYAVERGKYHHRLCDDALWLAEQNKNQETQTS